MKTDPITPALTREAKHALVTANREALERDLFEGRLVYESKPRTVEWQFSNFCNMSCIMCYDGNNPPMKKMPSLIVERLARELLPTAAIVQPFYGSEPLVVTWDLSRDLATEYRLQLDIVTNLQYLDEAKFKELEPHVSAIIFSIDSHIEGIYSRIRLRAKTDQVFRNLQGISAGTPIYENYDTHTGKPMQASHFSWSAACLIMMYNDYGK